MTAISKNSEILFLYDAKNTNPNGDMDNENKPRMDFDTSTNLVSDVRLKRYVRDYLEGQLKLPIFITDKATKAEDRNKQLKAEKLTHLDLIDCRLFGAVLAESGANTHYTGPIQFNWGYSLNKVELTESTTITSSFSSGGGIGKDYRVKYSLLAFNGSINSKVAEGTKLTDDDLKKFDEAMINAIPFCRTRSKIGQTPRLYLRVEATDDKLFLKDLREFLKFEPKIDEFMVRNIDEYDVALNDLAEYLKSFGNKIEAVHYWKDNKLNLKGWENMPKIKLIEG